MNMKRLSTTSLLSLAITFAAGCGASMDAPSHAGGAAPPPQGYPQPAATAVAMADAPAAPMAPPAEMEHARGGAHPPPPPAAKAVAPGAMAVQQFSGVKAGEWDDNANYREFQKWLKAEGNLSFHKVDISDRQFIVVRDADGKAVPRCTVTVRDEKQQSVKLTTTASGRAIFFPRAEGFTSNDLTASANCQNSSVSTRFSIAQTDGVVDLKLSAKRVLPAVREVDMAFILDTTGSMSEEIAAVKATLQKVASSLSGNNVKVRIGLVEYKDRTDPFVTKVYPMSTDLDGFSRQVAAIRASGGGDTPESMNEGLHVGLTGLKWNPNAVARLAFLIADAPPHLDYPNDFSYSVDMRDAAHQGIQVFTVAASGMDALGQVVFRQIAQFTGATNLFVLRGGAGAQSTGAGDPRSSCGGTQTNFTSGNLDALIIRKVAREIKGLDRDPLLIPGLKEDESAKPCEKRLQIAE